MLFEAMLLGGSWFVNRQAFCTLKQEFSNCQKTEQVKTKRTTLW